MAGIGFCLKTKRLIAARRHLESHFLVKLVRWSLFDWLQTYWTQLYPKTHSNQRQQSTPLLNVSVLTVCFLANHFFSVFFLILNSQWFHQDRHFESNTRLFTLKDRQPYHIHRSSLVCVGAAGSWGCRPRSCLPVWSCRPHPQPTSGAWSWRRPPAPGTDSLPGRSERWN